MRGDGRGTFANLQSIGRYLRCAQPIRMMSIWVDLTSPRSP